MKPKLFFALLFCVFVNRQSLYASTLVRFTEFMVSNHQDRILLKWATDMETNSDHFELQKSAHNNPDDFISVAHIPAAGESISSRSYQYVDQFPMDGVSYYRIKQVDKDNQFVYSSIMEIKYEPACLIRSFLNPVNEVLFVSFNIILPGERKFELKNMIGLTVMRGNLSNGALYLPIAHLPQGIYLLTVQMSNRRDKLKIVKQ